MAATGKMRTCALVGASDFNSEHFKTMDNEGVFDYVIAVDGGFASLEGIERKPDMAVGDFDSLGYVPKGLRVVKFPEHKDKSDMELALERAKKSKFEAVIIYGALGRRLDHTIANLQIFSKFSEQGLDITVIDEANALFFLTGPNAFEAPAKDQGTVSVFSMRDESKGVFERGMEWDLDDVVLSNQESLGLSNELKGEAVLIGVEEGTLLIFYPL